MKRVPVMMLVLAITACVHRSPEARVLAAFGESGVVHAPDPERDTIAAKCGKPFYSVRSITGDTAIVALVQDCIDRRVPPCPPGTNCMYSNAIRFETDYLVVRRIGKWKVDRAVAGGTLIGA